MDSSSIPWPSTLPAPLLERTHQGVPRSEFTVMESGRVRSRPLFAEAIEFIDVGWHFTQDQFEEFEAFYLTDLSNGSLPFVLETTESAPTGGTQTVERTLSFWDRFSFTHSDNLYAVSATLEVNETEVEATDLCRIDLVGFTGGGDNLDCYLGNLPMHGLASGNLGGSWVDNPLWVSIWAEDSFQSYSGGVAITGLNGGLVWGGAWVDSNLFVGVVAEDSFDSYADDTLMTGLSGGNEWGGAWVDSALTG